MQLVLDHLVRNPQNFPWWTSVQKLTLNEVQDHDTDKKVDYLVKFVRTFKHLRELELLCSQPAHLFLAGSNEHFCDKVTTVVPF